MEVKSLRKAKRLSQKRLGEMVGVSQQSIQKIEAGERNPSLVLAKKLSAVLGVSLDDLVAEKSAS